MSLDITAAQATGGSGSNTLLNVKNLTGSAFADTLSGNSATNALNGARAMTRWIVGMGVDKLTGGMGAVKFVCHLLAEMGLGIGTKDPIVDFKSGEGDKNDLSGVDANDLLSGDQAFSYLGAVAAFTGDATGQLRFDAATAAEFAIVLTGISSLAAADMVL